MSLSTWKKEFYPETAEKFSRKRRMVSVAIEAIEHSIRKWEGLRKRNLKKHQVERGHSFPNSVLVDARPFSSGLPVNASTCSLCQYSKPYPGGVTDCEFCPLAHSRQGVSCSFPLLSIESVSPWSAWVVNSDPLPMIKALKKALRYQKAIDKRAKKTPKA